MISLLTPVIKGFQTDKGFEMAVAAQQVWGGHGYIEDGGMSQFARDARIAMIYEGANGVQALDLVGRKLAADGGKQVMAFFAMVKDFIKENEGDAALKDAFLEPLKKASKDAQAAGMYFAANGMKNPNDALAGSYDFMHLMGHVCLGLMWAQHGESRLCRVGCGRRCRVFEHENRHRALLHGAAFARHCAASGADSNRGRTGHGASCRCVLRFVFGDENS